MSLLLPLGLLGLLSILVLILIYILKPNYQQKVISSTFVWKLSLKYRKKRIPISRLRNILIIICQILILTGLTFVLTKPVIEGKKYEATEEVLIIDASGSMLVEYEGATRFERAVDQIETRVTNLLTDGGVVTIIVADTEPYFLAQRVNLDGSDELFDKLDELVDGEELACSYSSADMEASVKMAQNVVTENPKANVYFYTATTYIDTNNIEIVNVADEDEWNVAVLDCKAEYGDDNYYEITVDIGCYNRSEAVTVYCEIEGPNDATNPPVVLESEEFYFSAAEEEQTITFTSEMQENQLGEKIYQFTYIRVYVEEADNLQSDNTYYIYGGLKEEIKVQYASTFRNNFFRSGMYALRSAMSNVWNIKYNEVDVNLNAEKPEYETEDYDVYIFEHFVPKKLPTDGVVVLVDPYEAPTGSGLLIDGYMGANYYAGLTGSDPHPLTNGMTPEGIGITKYSVIRNHDGYEELMYYGNDPVLLAKNDDDAKVVVLALDLNYSNFAMLVDFPMFLYNIFQYFLPPTITDFAFEVGATVTLNARGEELSVQGGDIDETFTEFPTSIVVNKPGSYTLTQVDFSGEYIIENFYVSIPKFESNITKEIGALPLLYVEERLEQEDKDLLVYFAAAIVALLFLEWWLQSREYF